MQNRNEGNTYAMDTWVRKENAVKRTNDSAMKVGGASSISREGVRKQYILNIL